MGDRQRIAVLGGGLGSLATLFHLTEQPDWAQRYDITLYQQGWRLGGKCASGRDLRPGWGSRIQEHGLHLFGGFYHYSFAMLRRCYESLERPADHPNRRVWDAFTGVDEITLMDKGIDADGSVTFAPWQINFEPLPGQPGDGVEPPTVTALMRGMIQTLAIIDPSSRAPFPAAGEGAGGFLKQACDHLERFAEDLAVEASREVAGLIVHALECHDRALAQVLEPPARSRVRMAIFLVQTIIRGVVVDGVLTGGFDPLDALELKDWIRKHGEVIARDNKESPDPAADAAALADWPVVRGSYDYVFGYADGDPDRPAQGAGTALRGMLRLVFGYKGHLFYTMRGGMGDVVVAPLYQALQRRGVKFAFFSRVERLTPGSDADGADAITAIEIARQARPRDGAYDPLVGVPLPGWPQAHPLPSWPAEPLWDQLEDGAALRASGVDLEAPWTPAPETYTLELGRDFDRVVLGISLGELHRVCAELPPVKPAWATMFDKLAITRTLALQLWFRRTNEDLGCDGPNRTLTGDAQPLSCWADMTHLLARETWDGGERPLSLHYFCGQMRGAPASSQAEADAATSEVAEAARVWLLSQGVRQWPGAVSGQSRYGVDTALLVDPEGRVGDDRFQAQYWRANTTPSEMYVQYVPGSVAARLRADESGFANLFLCGDWTRNGLNAGAAEAAVMSGVICANAIAGDVRPIAGERDLPP